MAKSFDELVKRTMSPALIKRAKQRTKVLREEYIHAQIRRADFKSQQEITAAMGIAQPCLSNCEKQGIMQFSTFRRLITALGGELEVVAKFPKR
jgi:predicted XRE-type DNA-binding protein